MLKSTIYVGSGLIMPQTFNQWWYSNSLLTLFMIVNELSLPPFTCYYWFMGPQTCYLTNRKKIKFYKLLPEYFTLKIYQKY